jgi:hypothetical protein
VARDGDVNLVGNVALAATRIQKGVTRGDGQMALSVVIIASGEMARAVSSSLGNNIVTSSNRSHISSASFGIQLFHCRKYDIPVPL